MASSFVHRRTVEFAETDMAGIVHFANFFRWMESAEHSFFQSLGLMLHGQTEEGMRGWARVHAECDYKTPLRYPDDVEVKITVREKRATSITYDHVFTRVSDGGAEEVARGVITAVYVGRALDEDRMRAMPIPEDVARLVEVAPQAASDTET